MLLWKDDVKISEFVSAIFEIENLIVDIKILNAQSDVRVYHQNVFFLSQIYAYVWSGMNNLEADNMLVNCTKRSPNARMKH